MIVVHARACLGGRGAHVVEDVVLGRVVVLLGQTKVERDGGMRVDQAQHVHAGNVSGVQDRLALKLVEEARYLDDNEK